MAASWMAAPGMAALAMAASLDGCSFDGCFLVFLLTLNKSKNLVVILGSYFVDFEQVKNKIPMGGTGCLCIFFLFRCLMPPALHPGFSDL